MQVTRNKQNGEQFEKLVVWRAGLGGLLAVKNPLSFKYLARGKIQPLRTDLDFKLIRRDGRMAFCDAKSFDGESFTYSQIDKYQLQRAVLYCQWNVPAGFVVWLRSLGQVLFYAAPVLVRGGARKRFVAADGVLLGGHLTFDLKTVFDALAR